MATRKPNRAVQVVAALAAVGMLGGLVVGAIVGLGGGTTTTSTSAAPTTSTTTTPLTAEQYRQRVDVSLQMISEAGGERCALAAAYTDVQALPPPSDTDQMMALIAVTVALLRASAVSATTDQPDASAQIAATADALEAEAEAAGFEPGWLADAGTDSALADPAFEEAFASYQELTFEQCFADSVDPAEPGN
ncbi:MAG: hypothetical protein ACR2OH_07245 [Microthrixaceae bacterium]